MRAAAVNVDVDSLYLYYRLHDLDERQATNVVWERGVRRFAALFDEVGVKATFFVVAADLERWPAAREVALELVAAGHEIGSHSWSHPYDLTRLPIDQMAGELDRAHDALSTLVGRSIVGFRAPGYTMTDPLLSLLAERGYTYDSSYFPCPPYYLAKLAVLASMALRRKTSQSIVGDPRVLVAPTSPHRRKGLLEIPVTVLPWLRFPFIGTSLLMMGQRGFSAVKPWLGRVPFVNLELHGIDMCDLEEDGIDRALLKQPDLRVPLAEKRALFRRVFTHLRDGWGVSTLEQLTPQLAAA